MNHLSKLILVSLLFSSNLFAQDIKITGTIDKTLKSPQKTLNGTALTQDIKLLKIELSKKALDALGQKAMTTLQKPHAFTSSSTLPHKVSLGMNGVPVLNQGKFGTCVTFATTAAIDAVLNKGDYISQICQLQLNTYLAQNGYGPDGWQGSLGRFVLSQMEHFGIVNKEKQKTIGCGGLTEYPQGEIIPDTPMSLEQFHELSESIGDEVVGWSPILDIYEAIIGRVDTNKIINDVKNSLNDKERVTFAVLLADLDLGLMGALGTHNAKYDTWVLTPEITRDLYLRQFFGGHEMVITGYDDDAVATDEQGNQHKGLFTLRNSWGEQFGDKGEFYMSYDYFKVLVIEAQRIRDFSDKDVLR